MALPFPTTYFIGIGTAISNLGVPTELSGGSYARLACAFTGSAIAGMTQTFGPWVVATAPTPAVNCTYGLMFDALTGGNLIAYWNWSPGTNGTYTGSLTPFPSTVVNISLTNNIAIAANMALLGAGSPGTWGSMFDQGAQLGTVNGNPMLAGVRLSINAQGSLEPFVGGGAFLTSADVQDSLFSDNYGTNNIVNGVTALAGGLLTGNNPVMTGFINRVTVVATTADSVILPGPTICPVGSFLVIINSGANALGVWPDTGSSINAAAVNATMLGGIPTVTATWFFRVTSTLWMTVPKTAS